MQRSCTHFCVYVIYLSMTEIQGEYFDAGVKTIGLFSPSRRQVQFRRVPLSVPVKHPEYRQDWPSFPCLHQEIRTKGPFLNV